MFVVSLNPVSSVVELDPALKWKNNDSSSPSTPSNEIDRFRGYHHIHFVLLTLSSLTRV